MMLCFFPFYHRGGNERLDKKWQQLQHIQQQKVRFLK